MMFWLRLSLFFLCSITLFQTQAQSISDLLKTEFDALHRDTCLTKADISFTLVDTKAGKILFEHHKDLLLAPASTLKTFTTATALKVLGENFRYETRISFKGTIDHNCATGQLIVYGCGDPSLGSDRFTETKPYEVYKKIGEALRKKGIQKFRGNIQVIQNIFTDESVNKGWLDEDIGNYYGAGIYGLNWKENKFEIRLLPTDTTFRVVGNTAGYHNHRDFCIELKQKEGSGTEEAFAFVEKNKACKYVIRGMLAAKKEPQTLLLASLDPAHDFVQDLTYYLKKGFQFEYKHGNFSGSEEALTTIVSPPLTQIVYWCNQKSLNLYAESLCKMMAVHLFKKGSWNLGLAAMLRYAESLKMDVSKVTLLDACGLSPENKITTALLAGMLASFTKEKNYPAFYASLPSINGLIMKSGYIGGTRSYAGYIKLKDQTEAAFAFIVHNYTCSPGKVKLKMFQVLDKLK